MAFQNWVLVVKIINSTDQTRTNLASKFDCQMTFQRLNLPIETVESAIAYLNGEPSVLYCKQATT